MRSGWLRARPTADSREIVRVVMNGILALLVPIIACWMITIPVIAQTTAGSISGPVTDASGAGVPGAQVTAINAETGAQRASVTGLGWQVPTSGLATRYLRPPRGKGRLQHHHSAGNCIAGDSGCGVKCRSADRNSEAGIHCQRRPTASGYHQRSSEWSGHGTDANAVASQWPGPFTTYPIASRRRTRDERGS